MTARLRHSKLIGCKRNAHFSRIQQHHSYNNLPMSSSAPKWKLPKSSILFSRQQVTWLACVVIARGRSITTSCMGSFRSLVRIDQSATFVQTGKWVTKRSRKKSKLMSHENGGNLPVVCLLSFIITVGHFGWRFDWSVLQSMCTCRQLPESAIISNLVQQ